MAQTAPEYTDPIARFKAWTVERDRLAEESQREADEQRQRKALRDEADTNAMREAFDRRREAEEAANEILADYEPPEQLPEPESGMVWNGRRDQVQTDRRLVIALEDEIARLTAQVREKDAIIASLRAKEELRPGRPQLPFHRSLDEVADRIVKLRADLFHNSAARKGLSKFKVTLFVWLDNKNANAGNIKSLTFPLKYHPKSQEMTGHLVWKGPTCKQHGIRGTGDVLDHLCLVWRDECRVAIGGRQIELDEFEPTPDGLAVKRWYWNA